jgi:hypothetical protein
MFRRKKPRSERGGSERGDEARLEGWGRKTKRTYLSNTISADLFRPLVSWAGEGRSNVLEERTAIGLPGRAKQRAIKSMASEQTRPRTG